MITPFGRVRRAIGEAVLGRVGAVDLAALPTRDSDDLRAITTLFRVLDRQPVYTHALDHCLDVVRDIGDPAPITRIVIGALLDDVATHFRGKGFDDRADEVGGLAGAREHNRSVLHLVAHLSASDHERTDARVVEAVVRALLSDLDRAPGVKRENTISLALDAAYRTGNVPLLTTIVERAGTTTVLDAVLDRFAARVAAAGTPAERSTNASRLTNVTQVITDHDPAFEPRLRAAKEAELQARAVVAGSPDALNVFHAAGDAARKGDMEESARHYDACSRHPDLSPAMRATMRVLAIEARLNADLVQDDPAMIEVIEDSIRNGVFQARSTVDLAVFLFDLAVGSMVIHERGGTAEPAVRAAELAAEHRAGIAVQRGSTHLDAGRDVALVDLLASDAVPFRPAELAARHADLIFLWVSTFTTDDHHNGLFAHGLECASGRTWFAKHVFTGDVASTFVTALGDTSVDLDDDQVLSLSRVLFADITAGGPVKIVIVPDPVAWLMPWNRLAPANAVEICTAPSAGAVDRTRGVARGGRKRIVGLFDEQLTGAELERTALAELSRQGHVEFDEAHSYSELRELLRTGEYDLLTIAVHGTSSNGYEYRLLFPDGRASPASIVQLRLPPIVVLGCCWSAQSTENPDMVATPVCCLAAGAEVVVGGLWAIADAVSGRLLADTYRRYAAGEPFARAFRTSYVRFPPEDAAEAAGVVLVGAPPADHAARGSGERCAEASPPPGAPTSSD